MPELTPKQKKTLERFAKIKSDKDVATVEMISDLEDKLDSITEKVGEISTKTDEKLSELSEELKKKLESELVLEIDKEELKGEDGEDGEDYFLTEKDIENIASKVKVPVVEKVIEKTEVIKEIPIITNEIKEVAITDDSYEIRNKLEAIPKGKEQLAFGAIRESDEILKDIKELKERPTQTEVIREVGGMGGSGGIDIYEDGLNIKQGATRINFGSGLDVTPSGNGITVTLDGSEPTNFDLQEVTDNGATTTNDVTLKGTTSFLDNLDAINTVKIRKNTLSGSAQIVFINGDGVELVMEEGDGYIMLPNTDLVISSDLASNNPNLTIGPSANSNDTAISINGYEGEVMSIGKHGDVVAPTFQCNNSYTPTGSETTGTTYWDSANHTTSTVLENGVILQNGQEIHIYGKNVSGSPITNGQPVSIISNNGQFTAFGAVDITTPAAYAFVGLATQDIAVNGFGYVTKVGVVRDIDTSLLDEGKPVYVSPTGGLTKTYPTVPNYVINVGIVEYKHSQHGRINVIPLIVPRLADLSDVDGTPTTKTGQVAVWKEPDNAFDFDKNILKKNFVNTSIVEPAFTYTLGNLTNITYSDTAQKDLTYNIDGTLNTITVTFPDASTVTKTLVWSSGVLQRINIV